MLSLVPAVRCREAVLGLKPLADLSLLCARRDGAAAVEVVATGMLLSAVAILRVVPMVLLATLL